ncbi:MAG TPA: TM0106 family RecB-like putative nuclease [Candidatus Thermoplasmatota archaeon]|nr:TM0106 family RecB-like putative nuclease [Candidatus Thermoplasmatota archaeon]
MPPRLDPARVAEEVAAEALRPSAVPVVTASDVHAFAQSPFSVWCDAFAPPEERDPEDEFRALLLEQGREHEARVLAARHPGAVPLRYEGEEEGFRLALQAMAEGAPALHGAPLMHLPEGLRGRVDLLERRDEGRSRFGPWHYVVKEVKLAKNVEDHHRLQAAFYNRLVGRLQGFTPATFHVVNRDHEEVELAYDDAEMSAVLDAVRAIRAGRLAPPAVHGAGAWPWERYTDKCAVERRDVSLVPGVGPALRERLVAAGFATVDHVAAAEPSRLRAVQGIGEKKAHAFRRSAGAIRDGRHVRLAPVRLDDAPVEVFLDLEGTGPQAWAGGVADVTYLIGALVRRGGEEAYVPFVAHAPAQEADAFRAFLAWLEGLGPCVVYHWSPYEATHLRRLAQRHGVAPEAEEALLGRLRDLHRVATGSFVFPTYDASVKSVARYAGFAWRERDVNALATIALYLAYARDPAANADKLRKVLAYNEDDCRAMRVVKDWLVANGA